MAAESPRETDRTFVTAAEELEAMPLPQEQDQAEVSSPVQQPGSNHHSLKRQVEELQQGTASGRKTAAGTVQVVVVCTSTEWFCLLQRL